MGFTQITASNITDLNGNKLASGTILFLATDQNDQPINFQVGGGGQALRRAISATVTNGAIAAGFQVPDPATTSPSGILYRIWVRDATTNQIVLDYHKVAFQGSSFNLDNYIPSANVVAPPAPGNTTGPLNVVGDASVTGNIGYGTLSGPFKVNAGARTFSNPLLEVINTDSSSVSTDNTAQCDTHLAPILRIDSQQRGGAYVPPLYVFSEGMAGFTGGLYGLTGSVDSKQGSRPKLIAHNLVTGWDSEFSITTASRTANVVTLTLDVSAAAHPFVVGDFLHVSGVSDTTFNTGRLGATLTAVTATTISYDQTAANATSSGGTVTLDTQFFGFELDIFNDAKDPTTLTPVTAQNNVPVWGWVGTNNGTYPATALFFANGPTRAYNGFLCQDAIDACFVAGYPTSGGSALQASFGFLARPAGCSNGTTSFSSLALGFQNSLPSGGTYVEHTYLLSLDTSSNLTFTFDGTIRAQLNSTGQLSLNPGSASTPGIGFLGQTGKGLYVDLSGQTSIAHNSQQALAFDGTLAAHFFGTIYQNGQQVVPFSGTTASLGGAAMTVGQRITTTVTVTGATTGMAVAVSPAADPGAGFVWSAWVSAANTVTVALTCVAAGTPTATTYNVRVIQ